MLETDDPVTSFTNPVYDYTDYISYQMGDTYKLNTSRSDDELSESEA